MDQSEIDKLVAERVQEAVAAELAKQQQGRNADEANAALRQMAASANQETSAGYGSGRSWRRGDELARLPASQDAALAVMGDMNVAEFLVDE